MEPISTNQSKAQKLKSELETLRAENKKREAQKRALLQRLEAVEKTKARKAEAHAKYCLGGALLKYRRHVADEVLAELIGDTKAPKGHVDAIAKLLAV
jgi:hypothetical protein